VIPVEQHQAINQKAHQTHHIEPFNNSLRQRLSRLVCDFPLIDINHVFAQAEWAQRQMQITRTANAHACYAAVRNGITSWRKASGRSFCGEWPQLSMTLRVALGSSRA
jgi:hypothetical protein